MNSFAELGSHLAHSPLMGIGLTLCVYLCVDWIYRKAKQSPLLNPVLLSILVIAGVLKVSDTDYQSYFEGAKVIHFLLGPATVALAIPLYKNLHHVRQSFFPILISITLGCLFAIISGVGIAKLLGGSEQILISLAPKSVTTPIAMSISQMMGGLPSLTAVFVILCGIIGAIFGGHVLNLVGVRDQKARGIAVGLASHGIATAHKLNINEKTGAFASLAMGLNGLATALLLPLLYSLYRYLS